MLLGWLHDLSGGYRASYIAAGACSLAGAAIILAGGSSTAPAEERVEVAA